MEAHGHLSEVAFKLRRALLPKSPAVKTAVKAERELFQLKRELQQFAVADAPQREPLPVVRRGSKPVDVEDLRRWSRD